MAAKKILIPVGFQVDDITAQLNVAKKALKDVRVDSSIGQQFTKAFAQAEKELDSFQKKAARGISTQGDIDALERSMTTTIGYIQKIQGMMGRISFKDLKLTPDQEQSFKKLSTDIAAAERAVTQFRKSQIENLQKDNANFANVMKNQLNLSVDQVKNEGEVSRALEQQNKALQKQIALQQQALTMAQGRQQAFSGQAGARDAAYNSLVAQYTTSNGRWKNGAEGRNAFGQFFQQYGMGGLEINQKSSFQEVKRMYEEFISSTSASFQQEITEQTAKLQELQTNSVAVQTALQDLTNALSLGSRDQSVQALENLKQKMREEQQAALDATRSNRDFGNGLDGASNKAKTFSGIVGELNNQLAVQRSAANLLTGMQNGIKQLVGFHAILTQVNRGIQAALGQIKELDTAMNGIAVVTDMSTSDLWGQINNYMSIAKQYGVTTTGTYQVSQLYYQQGLDTNAVMELTTETLKMAKIAGLDYANATDYMTVALNGFKLGAEEASMVVDVYSKLASVAATDTSELAQAMSKTASIAESSGMSFQATSAFLTQMIEVTREAPENLGTAMKTIIARFQEMKSNPTQLLEVDGDEASLNKVDAALKSVGVELKDASGQFRNLDEVIFELADVWDTLDRNTQRWIANTTAGSRQQSRFLALMSDSERLHELYQIALDSEDASLVQYAKTLDSVESKLNQLSTSFQQFYMSFFSGETYKGLLDAVQAFIDRLNEAGPLGAVAIVSAMISGISTIAQFAAVQIAALYQKLTETARASIRDTNEVERQRGESDGRAYAEAYNRARQGQQTPTPAPQTGNTGTATGLSKIVTGAASAASAVSLLSTVMYTMVDQSTKWGQAIGVATQAVNGLFGAARAFVGFTTGDFIGGVAGILQVISAITMGVNAIETAEERAKRLAKAVEQSQIAAAQAKIEFKDLQSAKEKIDKLDAKKYDSAEDMANWKKAVSDLAEKYPELISYVDAEGNAVLDLTDKYQELIDAKQQEARENRLSYLAARKAEVQNQIDGYQENGKFAYKTIENGSIVTRYAEDEEEWRAAILAASQLFEQDPRDVAREQAKQAASALLVKVPDGYQYLDAGNEYRVIDEDEYDSTLEQLTNSQLGLLGRKGITGYTSEQADAANRENLKVLQEYPSLQNELTDLTRQAAEAYVTTVRTGAQEVDDILNSSEMQQFYVSQVVDQLPDEFSVDNWNAGTILTETMQKVQAKVQEEFNEAFGPDGLSGITFDSLGNLVQYTVGDLEEAARQAEASGHQVVADFIRGSSAFKAFQSNQLAYWRVLNDLNLESYDLNFEEIPIKLQGLFTGILRQLVGLDSDVATEISGSWAQAFTAINGSSNRDKILPILQSKEFDITSAYGWFNFIELVKQQDTALAEQLEQFKPSNLPYTAADLASAQQAVQDAYAEAGEAIAELGKDATSADPAKLKAIRDRVGEDLYNRYISGEANARDIYNAYTSSAQSFLDTVFNNGEFTADQIADFEFYKSFYESMLNDIDDKTRKAKQDALVQAASKIGDNEISIDEATYDYLREVDGFTEEMFAKQLDGSYKLVGTQTAFATLLQTALANIDTGLATLFGDGTFFADALTADNAAIEKQKEALQDAISGIAEDGTATITQTIVEELGIDESWYTVGLDGKYDLTVPITQYLEFVRQKALQLLGLSDGDSRLQGFDQLAETIKQNEAFKNMRQLGYSTEDNVALIKKLRDGTASAEEAKLAIDELGYSIEDLYKTADGHYQISPALDGLSTAYQSVEEAEKDIKAIQDKILHSEGEERKRLEAILSIRKAELSALERKGILVAKDSKETTDIFADPREFFSNIGDLDDIFKEMYDKSRIEYTALYNMLNNLGWDSALAHSLGLVEAAQREGISEAEYFVKHYTDTYADMETGKVFLNISAEQADAIREGSKDTLKAYAEGRIKQIDAQLKMLESMKAMSGIEDIGPEITTKFNENISAVTAEGGKRTFSSFQELISYLQEKLSAEKWQALTASVDIDPEIDPKGFWVAVWNTIMKNPAEYGLDPITEDLTVSLEPEIKNPTVAAAEMTEQIDAITSAAELTAKPISVGTQVTGDVTAPQTQDTTQTTTIAVEADITPADATVEEWKTGLAEGDGATVTVNGDTQPLSDSVDTTVEKINKIEGAVTVKGKTDAALSDAKDIANRIRGLATYIAVRASDATKSTVDAIVASINSRTATIKVSTQTVGSTSTTVQKPSTNGTRLTAAGGTDSARAGRTLVGELGPELVVSGNSYHMVGADGAEFVNLRRGDIVFDAGKTAGLLNGVKGIRGTAMAGGSSGLDAAIQALLAERAMWSTVLNSVSGLLDKAGRGGKSGGGGGGSVDKEYLMELERWFNWLRQIEQLENKITVLRARRQNMTDGKMYAESLYEENAYLQKQADITKDLVEHQIAYRDSLKTKYLQEFGKYFYFVGDAIQINAEAILEDTKNNEELGDEIQKLIDEYDDITSQITDNTVALEDNEAQIRDNLREMRDAYIDVENEVLAALKNMYQQEIDLKQKALDAKTKADNAYLSSLKKNLEKKSLCVLKLIVLLSAKPCSAA